MTHVHGGVAASVSMSLRIDHTATLWAGDAGDVAERGLLVLLHGLRSNERDLFSLRPMLGTGPVIASLRAPMDLGGGWGWSDPQAPDAADRFEQSADAVLGWLDELPVAPSRIATLGFSQGGAVAVQLLRQSPGRVERTAMLAGMVPPREHPNDASLAESRPAVFWGRGDADPVIPQDAVRRSERWLFEHTAVRARVYAGLGHSVSIEEITDAAAFLT